MPQNEQLANASQDSFDLFWTPRTDAQRAALQSNVEFLLFGGAAGSLKSETMLVNAIKYRDHRYFSSVIFRRTFPELDQLIKRSRDLYLPLGARYNENKKTWEFPSGGRVRFQFCERDDDINRRYGDEYDFIGFDESTHFGEFPVRFMFSRLRSKDPFLQEHLRMHLATNPGNQGHIWHKAVFLGPTCTHCRIVPQSRLPGRVYTDARWPSDGRAIGKTTTFIPGRLSDHALLGVDYAKQLDGLPSYLAKALKEGCWDVFAGQYFDVWDDKKMLMDRAAIYEKVQWWWPHWVGIDYGFNVSQAVAYLVTKSPPELPNYPRGRVWVIDEFAAKHMMARDFAMAVRDMWHVGERKMLAHYLSPDAWAKRGDGNTLADQMSQSTNISFEKASNDRIGGAMLMYTMLDSGELVIGDNCVQLKACLPSRIHDPDRPDDVLKVVADPYDDCFDAIRYAIYSYIRSIEKPNSVMIAEAMYSQDPTIAMIQRRMAEAKIQRSDEPIFYNEMGERRWRM